MDFRSVLVFVYVGGFALGLGSFLTLLRQLGLRTLTPANRSIVRFNTRMTSYLMLLGLLVLSFASGAILCHQLLRTSQFPEPVLLAMRVAAMTAIIAPSIFLHVRIMPILNRGDGRRIVDTVAASEILSCTLAASISLLGWSFLVLASTQGASLLQWQPAQVLPSLATAVLFVWALLSVVLLGEQGLADIKDFAARTKKRLTPPTRIEMQRMMRARRMHTMILPSTPRRR
jgi:hypothetical protein